MSSTGLASYAEAACWTVAAAASISVAQGQGWLQAQSAQCTLKAVFPF